MLNRAIEVALASNLKIEQAVARVAQAKARARIARSPRFPGATPSASAGEIDSPTNAGIGAQLDELGFGSRLVESFGVALPDRLQLQSYGLTAEFNYEIDFWRRVSQAADAAHALQRAEEALLKSAHIAVLSETIATYLELVDLRRQGALVRRLLKALSARAELAETRYQRGITDARPVFEIWREKRQVEMLLPDIDAAAAASEARFWILLGGFSEEVSTLLATGSSPAIDWQSAPAGIPSDLLTQRPDVAAARERMHAAHFALGVAQADMRPSLSLSGMIGLTSTESGDWFDPDQWISNLGFNLLGPTFQGGRLRGRVEHEEARLQEAVAAYGQAVITALGEVEAALASLEASERRYQTSTAHLGEARNELALQEDRYTSGVADYAEVLFARQLSVSAEVSVSSSARELGLARLGLHRALGGTWTADNLE